MSTTGLGWICFLLAVCVPMVNSTWLRGVNGGSDCLSCTLVLGVVEHLSILYNESIVVSLERFCSYLPTQFRIYCKEAVEFLGKARRFRVIEQREEYLGPVIVDGFLRKETPDVICHALKLCHDDPGQNQCRLFPSKTSLPISLAERGAALRRRHPAFAAASSSKICTIPGIKEICKILENVFNNHLPLVDVDGDRFGTEASLRGSSWRGKDCNDFSSKIRPGARSRNGDPVNDENCNGIFGLDSTTGRPWEEELCDDKRRLGIAVLGDSISAHFHLPEQWLDARQLNVGVFDHLLFIIENELDWPQMSAATGHVNVSWPNIEGKPHTLNTSNTYSYCMARSDTFAVYASVRSRSLQSSRLSEHRREWCE